MTIRIENISKAYDGNPVLSDFSATFENGKRYLITGRSGIGKTTLIRLIMGLEMPDKGTIRANERFSCALQSVNLLKYYDVYTNIRAFTGLDKETVGKMIAPILDEASCSKPVAELSGGQQQKVNVARALLAESDCVILDEPFNNLDGQSIKELIEFINNNIHERTLIIVSHQLDQLDLDRYEHIEINKRDS